MKKCFIYIIAFFAVIMPLCVFAQNSRITLSDNTTIYGTVVGMNNGVYVIKTETMGELNINAENVVSISSLKNNPKSADNLSQIKIIEESDKSQRSKKNTQSNNSGDYSTSLQEQANMRVQSMTMDSNFLDSLMNLSENSMMTDIMNDPEIMDAIGRGDYEFLMQNDKMNGLMESDDIKSLLGDM